MYSGTRLIWTPRAHAKVSVLTGVRTKQINFRENVWAFPRRDKQNCPQYPGVRRNPRINNSVREDRNAPINTNQDAIYTVMQSVDTIT